MRNLHTSATAQLSAEPVPTDPLLEDVDFVECLEYLHGKLGLPKDVVQELLTNVALKGFTELGQVCFFYSK